MRKLSTIRIALPVAAVALAVRHDHRRRGSPARSSAGLVPPDSSASPASSGSERPPAPGPGDTTTSAPLPTITLTENPPKDRPADTSRPWVVGMVTSGGTGPCYAHDLRTKAPVRALHRRRHQLKAEGPLKVTPGRPHC